MRRASGPSFGVFVAHLYIIIIIGSLYDGTYAVTSVRSRFVLLIAQPHIFYVTEREKIFFWTKV